MNKHFKSFVVTKTTSIICTVLLLPFISACSPKITTTIHKTNGQTADIHNIEVYNVAENISGEFEVLGTVKIGDTGFTTNCKYEYVVELAKWEAAKVGGDAIKIFECKEPDAFSTCYRIQAYILKKPDAVSVADSTTVYSASSLQNTNSESTIYYQQVQRPKYELPSYRVAFNCGFAKRMGEPAEPYDYTKHISKGLNLSGAATYFFSDTWGAGITGNLFKTSYEMGNLSDKITISYVGAHFAERYAWMDRRTQNLKCAVVFDISFGYAKYSDRATYDKNGQKIAATINGAAIGLGCGVGFDYHITPSLALGVQLDGVMASLSKVEYHDPYQSGIVELPEDEYESLGHWDFTAGLRYAF